MEENLDSTFIISLVFAGLAVAAFVWTFRESRRAVRENEKLNIELLKSHERLRKSFQNKL